MKRSEVIDNSRIAPGQVVVGLASHGQANWEREYNGGMGSNGLTSARHDVFNKSLMAQYPESFDPGTDQQWVYTGTHGLQDAVDGVPLDAGKLVLSPTRTYAPLLPESCRNCATASAGWCIAPEALKPRFCTSSMMSM